MNPGKLNVSPGDSPAIAHVWIPALTGAVYPWLLEAFHWTVTPTAPASAGAPLSAGAIVLAGLLLIAALSVPLLNLIAAQRQQRGTPPTFANVRAQRYTLLAVAAPTLYVFFGVLSYMAGSKVPDPYIWTPAWLTFGWFASRGSNSPVPRAARPGARLRVAHGISGAIVALYVLFHLFNHLCGLVSPELHAAVMESGRKVYRATFIEPLLVLAMLFQIASGLRLVMIWTRSGAATDSYRLFQIASGAFLSVFILGHMNSVFIYARSWLHIPTDWAFAAGLPTGLIHDAWNIRLLPHYALGVFFVLAHLASALRVVLLAHGTRQSTANHVWWSGAVLSFLISAAIICGMAGIRVSQF